MSLKLPLSTTMLSYFGVATTKKHSLGYLGPSTEQKLRIAVYFTGSQFFVQDKVLRFKKIDGVPWTIT